MRGNRKWKNTKFPLELSLGFWLLCVVFCVGYRLLKIACTHLPLEFLSGICCCFALHLFRQSFPCNLLLNYSFYFLFNFIFVVVV